jgi:hypothetical protein
MSANDDYKEDFEEDSNGNNSQNRSNRTKRKRRKSVKKKGRNLESIDEKASGSLARDDDDDYLPPNEFDKLVKEVRPDIKHTFLTQIKVPTKIEAPKTFIVSQHAELKVIDNIKEKMKKKMEEKKNEKKESMFKFYAKGFQAGVQDLNDDYD